ncbi:MAG: hypothetical protein ACOVQE_05845 [Chitinophagaceae bacterium]
MKQLLAGFTFLLLIVTVSFSCKKSSGSGTTNPPVETEENLAVTLNPAVGSTLAPQPLLTGLALTVTVASKMPSKGVQVDVQAAPEAGGSSFFTNSVTNSNAANNFTIGAGGLIPTGVVSVATVTVTSVSKPANKWTGSFRFSAK